MSSINTMQIANQLKLSRNTVSKALNNSPEVNEKTKKLVISTAVNMGYKKINKNDYATFVNNQTNYDICLLVHEREMVNNFWSSILKGVEEYLTMQKCRIILGILDNSDENNELMSPAFQGNQAAGIITIGTYSENFFTKLKETGIPVVTIDSAASVRDNKLLNDTVLVCNDSCVYEITEYLINRGYRDIAFVGDPNHCKSIQERWTGYKYAMFDHNLCIPEEYKYFQEICIEAEYDDIAAQMKHIQKLPEALVCANDIVANKVIRILKEHEIRVPEDIAVSGFDNYDSPIDSESRLTSVSFNFKELGMSAAKQVLYRIENPTSSLMLIRLESHVIFRESTDAEKK